MQINIEKIVYYTDTMNYDLNILNPKGGNLLACYEEQMQNWHANFKNYFIIVLTRTFLPHVMSFLKYRLTKKTTIIY